VTRVAENGASPREADSLHQRVAEANRLYYAATAATYDATENCVVDPRAQEELRADVSAIARMFSKAPSDVTVLDACAGSGNLTRKLLDAGLRVTALDISPDLLARLRARCAGADDHLDIVQSEVATYMERCDRHFDLICFSSALHHLADVDRVLAVAADRLAEGGLLYTIFDPIPQADQRRLARWFQRADYLAFKVFRQWSDFPAAVRRRLRRTRKGARIESKGTLDLDEDNLGFLAEYHVELGIDDRALVRRLTEENGLEVVWHERMARGRSETVERVLRSLGACTSFKLLLRRPSRVGEAPAPNH
jgi:SAM-dependent methyltransferase